MPWAILVGGAVGLVAACLALARIENLAEAPRTFLGLYGAAFACYGGALLALARLPARVPLSVVMVVALLFPPALLLAPPTLSTDIYPHVLGARGARARITP